MNDCLNINIKSDLFFEKKTLPNVYLSNVLDNEKRDEFIQLLAKVKEDSVTNDIQIKLKDFIELEGAVHYTSVMCTYFENEALSAIQQTNLSEEQKRLLMELV